VERLISFTEQPTPALQPDDKTKKQREIVDPWVGKTLMAAVKTSIRGIRGSRAWPHSDFLCVKALRNPVKNDTKPCL
jgi:hypothetical protein